ncbi:hypothetical protein SAMN05421853_1239 [Roseivivax halotolerans]|uniref:Uncharacterized protein n=1 Tax=Roseivivax halotolerans TaxID=93684 RepID=A0A1I6AKC3_9RHOB|nr:type I-F CRISPR-associated endoribonuclease Cas6/Csy4 [Roseivivax halotolerans]SFQ69143.1 hypothetical protein SAMN05421853_1239 [Roseivivax halotolerans]
MTGSLNEGKGRCHGTARLLIKPVQAVIELGAAGDVREKSLNAVHHANRHGSPDDFIAVALPTMRMGRNCMLPGREIELIGSHASLDSLLTFEGFKTLVRRGMLQEVEIEEIDVEPGEVGAAYVRDRRCEKYTSGWLRRNKARAERRGKPWRETLTKARGNDLTTLPLRYGSAVLHVRQVIAEMTDTQLFVSTYGFSSPAFRQMAVLPVYPDAARDTDDAA